MHTVLLRHISEHVGESVRLKGWVIHHRPKGKLIFFEMRDGTGEIQCVVFKGDVNDSVFSAANDLSLETSAIVEGVVRRDERSKTGYELGVMNVDILQKPEEEYPISEKDHGVAFLLDNRHLWIRSSRQTAILKIRSTIIDAIHNFFVENEYIRFDTPIFTPSSCEGTTTLFETDYFNDKAYLTQSGQLYLEAGAMALGKVYSFGPTFRAEKSKTRRHLMEFWMVEPEMAFFSLEDDMNVAERFVAFIVSEVLEKNEDDLASIGRNMDMLRKVTVPFERISYDDAISLLKEKNIDISWGDDFGGDEETVLAEHFEKPVMVHRYPASCKAFYMKNDPGRQELALNFDMLAPEGYGEIIGGGQREDDYDTLYSKIQSHGLDVESFNWYLDLRKYGSIPHAGFGLGIERTVAWICGLHHVRETIPFPRLMDRMRP